MSLHDDTVDTLFESSQWTARPLLPPWPAGWRSSKGGQAAPRVSAPGRQHQVLVPAQKLQELEQELQRLREQLLQRDKQVYEFQLAHEASSILVSELQCLLQSRQQLQKQQSELMQENQLLWVERYLMSQQLGVDAADGNLVVAVQEAVQADVRQKRRQQLRQNGLEVRAAAAAAAAIPGLRDDDSGAESADGMLALESSGHLDDDELDSAAVSRSKSTRRATDRSPFLRRSHLQALKRSASSENLSARLSRLHLNGTDQAYAVPAAPVAAPAGADCAQPPFTLPPQPCLSATDQPGAGLSEPDQGFGMHAEEGHAGEEHEQEDGEEEEDEEQHVFQVVSSPSACRSWHSTWEEESAAMAAAGGRGSIAGTAVQQQQQQHISS